MKLDSKITFLIDTPPYVFCGKDLFKNNFLYRYPPIFLPRSKKFKRLLSEFVERWDSVQIDSISGFEGVRFEKFELNDDLGTDR